MENPTLNKTERERKNEDLQWKMDMLDVARTCLRSYQVTKDEKFIELVKSLMEQANYWEIEAQSRKTL